MSRGPRNVTSTTNVEPPSFLVGPLSNAANAASRAFNQGGAGSDLVPAAQDFLGRRLRGEFLDPSTNPFLQQTFDRAADLTRGRLTTEFGTSGRDLVASAPARSEELQTLSSQIFGGNFRDEMNRITGAIDQSRGFDPLNMLIDRLAGIIPGAGGTTTATQPVFRTGLF